MKYIRTKDGRIIDIPNNHRLINYGNETIVDIGAIANGERGHAIINGIIDRQADTIEELCDVFVCNMEEYGEPHIVHNIVYSYLAVKGAKGSYKNIYGAIWTDRGLIYVAKMNEKGELELL